MGITLASIRGKGFDFLIEASSVVYMLQDQSEKILFVCQEFQNLTDKQISIDVAQSRNQTGTTDFGGGPSLHPNLYEVHRVGVRGNQWEGTTLE